MASVFGFGKGQFLGRTTSDITLETSPQGHSFCKFSLAFDRYMGPNKEPITEFINFVAWRSQAESLANYVKKGTPLVIDAVYTSRKYTAEGESKPRVFVEFEVEKFYFCESKKSDGNNASAPATQSAPKPQQQAAAPSAPNDGFSELDGDDDDLPF